MYAIRAGCANLTMHSKLVQLSMYSVLAFLCGGISKIFPKNEIDGMLVKLCGFIVNKSSWGFYVTANGTKVKLQMPANVCCKSQGANALLNLE